VGAPREAKGEMMSRVLSTEQAKSAIQQIQSIVNGGFTDQISQLDAQGRILSDPNVWDGPLAAQFRGSTWPETKAALDKAKQELEELRTQLNSISQNIFSAGGGS
jgi:Asp-tRNA(Asn)/Glu-tRNA(Gln) amidotransferase C subunit